MSQDIVTRLRARTVPRWSHATAGTPVMFGHKPDPACQEAAAEIEQLRAANDAFGRRQEWWTSKMFDAEQEIERLRAVERRYEHLKAQFRWYYGTTTKSFYWELKPDTPRLYGETLEDAIDKATEVKP